MRVSDLAIIGVALIALTILITLTFHNIMPGESGEAHLGQSD